MYKCAQIFHKKIMPCQVLCRLQLSLVQHRYVLNWVVSTITLLENTAGLFEFTGEKSLARFRTCKYRKFDQTLQQPLHNCWKYDSRINSHHSDWMSCLPKIMNSTWTRNNWLNMCSPKKENISNTVVHFTLTLWCFCRFFETIYLLWLSHYRSPPPCNVCKFKC